MSDTLLSRLCDGYDRDMEVIRIYSDAIDVALMRDRIRSRITKCMKPSHKWWRMDSSYLADVLICGILNSNCLPVRAFASVTNITQTIKDDEHCVEFLCHGLDMTGNIHVTLMDGILYIIYHVIYEGNEYSTLWWISYDVILEDKGLS